MNYPFCSCCLPCSASVSAGWGGQNTPEASGFLPKAKCSAELDAILQDFNQAKNVFSGTYFSKTWRYRPGSGKIVPLNSISHFFVAIRPNRHCAIYYQPVAPNSKAVLFSISVSEGHHQAAQMLNGYLPRKIENPPEEKVCDREPIRRPLSEEEKHWDTLVNEILAEKPEA